MAISKHTKIVKAAIIGEYRKTLQFNLSYWQNHNDPESRYHLGINKQSKIEDAREQIDNANRYGITLQDVKESGYFGSCVRAAMRDCYIKVIDFEFNPYLKIGGLKQVVILRKIYDKIAPQHKEYSTRYLTNLVNY